MRVAEALARTMVNAGVDVCFMNPGTSEMHLVAALDAVPDLRGVLTLFEGVAAGAADGYARIAGRPASVLLHLGPGLGNGVANLHNARRAHSPVVVIVGDHALGHRRFDAPLQSDIETLAANVSKWVRPVTDVTVATDDVVEAIATAQSCPSGVSTLILPADISWSSGASPASMTDRRTPDSVRSEIVERAAADLRSREPAVLLLGGDACRGRALMDASRVSNATGARLLIETFPAAWERGAGLPAVERLAYLPEVAEAQLDGVRRVFLAGAAEPAAFFAYPGRDGSLIPSGCDLVRLTEPGNAAAPVLSALAEAVGAPADGASRQAPTRPDPPTGPLTADAACAIVGALMPEGTIISDESNTSGLRANEATKGAPRHDWLCLTGGAIGQGLPVALGAALAAPERQVIALQSEGSAMYTVQALWTMAREKVDVVTVIFNNSSYAILDLELKRVGADGTGPKARAMVDIGDPPLDFVALAVGHGVRASRVTTCEDFAEQLASAISERGPSVIEAIVPPIV